MTGKLAIIHCGYQKTGTTTLQRALDLAAQRDPRLLYPAAGRIGQSVHHNLTYELLGDDRFAGGNGGWAAVRQEIKAAQSPRVVISAESLCTVDPHVLRAAVQDLLSDLDYDVRIVVYIRPHLSRILSAYAQDVKLGFSNASLDDFVRDACARLRFAQSQWISRWVDVFGDSLALSVFDRKTLRGEDIVADFAFRHLPEFSGALCEIAATIPAQNVTPNLNVIEVMRIFSQRFETVGDRKKVLRHAWSISIPLIEHLQRYYAGPEPQLSFNAMQRQMLVETYRADAIETDRLMGTGTFFADALGSEGAGSPAAEASLPDDERHLHATYLAMLSDVEAAKTDRPHALGLHRVYLSLLAQLLEDGKAGLPSPPNPAAAQHP